MADRGNTQGESGLLPSWLQQAESQELCLGLLCRWQETKHLSHPEDAGVSNGGAGHCTPKPAPCCNTLGLTTVASGNLWKVDFRSVGQVAVTPELPCSTTYQPLNTRFPLKYCPNSSLGHSILQSLISQPIPAYSLVVRVALQKCEYSQLSPLLHQPLPNWP